MSVANVLLFKGVTELPRSRARGPRLTPLQKRVGDIERASSHYATVLQHCVNAIVRLMRQPAEDEAEEGGA